MIRSLDVVVQDLAIVEELAEEFMFGDVLYYGLIGEKLTEPLPVATTLYHLLHVTQGRRAHNLRSEKISDPDCILGSQDMTNIMNAWRKDVESWMAEWNYEVYYKTLAERRQSAHKFAKSRFIYYLLHLSCCKALVSELIAVPILSSSGPAAKLR